MKNRTYRYIEKSALFPFGYGLTYSKMEIVNAELIDNLMKVRIENVGEYDTDDIVQIYVKHLSSELEVKNTRLVGYSRVHLNKGESKDVDVELDKNTFTLVDFDGKRKLVLGEYQFYVSTSQPDARSQYLTGVTPLTLRKTR
ncbi:fibronectin type III-like domain-contianing protein [Weissella diestrammenae]